jgi:hypothetical protein
MSLCICNSAFSGKNPECLACNPEPKRAEVELSDEAQDALIEMRGGCSCHLSPPCGNHSDPLTDEEIGRLREMGLLKEGT